MNSVQSPVGFDRKKLQFFKSTKIYPTATELREFKFFGRDGYNNFYQNTDLPLTGDQWFNVLGLRISYNMHFDVTFGVTNAGKEKNYERTFLQQSKLMYKIGSTTFTEFPIHMLIVHDIYDFASTLAVRTKLTDFVPLKEPILMPGNQSFDWIFSPPTGLKTAGTGTAYLPDPPSDITLTTNMGFFIELQLVVQETEPVV